MSSTYPIREYDSNGNLIHVKYHDGYERWWERDSNGNRIHYKDSNGNEIWYDENGHLTKDPVKILLLSQKLYSEESI